jgi:hypothetical protein
MRLIFRGKGEDWSRFGFMPMKAAIMYFLRKEMNAKSDMTLIKEVLARGTRRKSRFDADDISRAQGRTNRPIC